MIQNYFKTALRNMQKNKLHTAINLSGMAIAFACAVLLLSFVYRQFTFDLFHNDAVNIYKIYSKLIGSQGEERSGSMPYPLTETLKKENIRVQYASAFYQGGNSLRAGNKILDAVVFLADADFFNIFSFPILNGAQQHPLSQANDIVLSATMAKNIFGTTQAEGKQIEASIGGKWLPLRVSAVVDDRSKESSFYFDAIGRIELSPSYAEGINKWNMGDHDVFIKTGGSFSKQAIVSSLRSFTKKYFTKDDPEEKYLKKQGYKADAAGDYFSLQLLPLKDLHFSKDLGMDKVISKQYLYILLVIAAVILLIAGFNFVNLNTGISLTRTREMGIRKCLGAGRREVWLQVFGESFLAVFFSMLTGFGLAFLLYKKFNQLFKTSGEISVLYTPWVIFSLLGLLFILSFLGSGYPANMLSRLKTVEILKGKISLKKPGFFRDALIIAQFIIAIVLISSTIIIYQQFMHLRNAPLGYNTSSLISIPVKQSAKTRDYAEKMRNLLASQTAVTSISASSVNTGIGKDGGTNSWGFGFDYNGRPINMNFMAADYDILKTLGIKTVEGRDLSLDYAADTTNAVIITESLAKQFGVENPLGLTFYSDSSKAKWRIVGVVPDFHLYSMRQEPKPLMIGLDKNINLGYLLIRINTRNPQYAMGLVKDAYKQVAPGEDFTGTFADENTARWYNSEKALGNMFSVASLVAIVLSCMGLFGIAFMLINQSTKEIGVRKVLGASVENIAAKFTITFLRPVFIAFLIAIPIVVLLMNHWLRDFIYRIKIEWTVFAMTGLAAVLIAVLTISIQVFRAAMQNPVKSLRTE